MGLPSSAELIYEHGVSCGKIVCSCCRQPNVFAVETETTKGDPITAYLCRRCDTLPGQLPVLERQH